MKDIYYPVEEKGLIKVRLVDNKIVPHYIIENQFSKKFSGYRLIEKDLNDIKEALAKLMTTDYKNDTIISQSLSFMIVITYGKCFAKAKGRNVKLEKLSALSSLTPSEIKTHDELILMRNEYLAHGGVSKFESNPVSVTRILLQDGVYGYMAHDSVIYMSSFKFNLNIIQSILEKILKYVKGKMDKSFTQLMTFIVNEMPKVDFEQNSFLPDLSKCLTIEDLD